MDIGYCSEVIKIYQIYSILLLNDQVVGFRDDVDVFANFIVEVYL